MSETTTITITILGKSYKVSCAAGEEDNLRRSAAYLDERMRETKDRSGVISLGQLAVTVALNIANDLLLLADTTEQSPSSQEKLQQLADKMDSANAQLRSLMGSPSEKPPKQPASSKANTRAASKARSSKQKSASEKASKPSGSKATLETSKAKSSRQKPTSKPASQPSSKKAAADGTEDQISMFS